MKNIYFIIPTLLIMIASCSKSKNDHEITLGKNTFCIPKRHSTLDQTSGPLFNIKGADTNDGSSFQTIINSTEIKQEIPEYLLKHGEYSALFRINVSQVSTDKLTWRLSNKYYANVLQLTHDYENAQVEYVEKYHFYRISNWGFPPPFILWEALKIKPDKNAVMPDNLNDYHIASCLSADGVAGIDGTGSSCDYSLDIDGYLVEIRTTENNLHLKGKITTYAKKLLTTWISNCK